MSSEPPIVVYPPDEDGGRRVRIDGTIVGRAFAMKDVVEFLRCAGHPDVEDWPAID
ncbi:hypothetical protein [Streptomyces laurentii]|uniref:hypothetical protein n=1 Tax=Streptomyces laurentii TaxID=39478 RepID=UPI0033C1F803